MGEGQRGKPKTRRGSVLTRSEPASSSQSREIVT